MSKLPTPLPTPWGMAENVMRVHDGIWNLSTPRHGGDYVAPEYNKKIPLCVRKATWNEQGLSGFYEEDLDVIIPVIWFGCWHDRPKSDAATIAKLRQYIDSPITKYPQEVKDILHARLTDQT